jgi:hypothetical protein
MAARRGGTGRIVSSGPAFPRSNRSGSRETAISADISTSPATGPGEVEPDYAETPSDWQAPVFNPASPDGFSSFLDQAPRMDAGDAAA